MINKDEAKNAMEKLEEIEKELHEQIDDLDIQPKNKKMIQLPQDNHTLSQFAEELSKEFKESEDLYYKPNENILVEIQEYEDKLLKQKIVGFRTIDPKRLLNIIENKINTYTLTHTKNGNIETIKTASEQIIKLLSANTTFIRRLHPIHRFLNYPLPFINESKKLIIPKKGYDKRYQAYFTPETPQLTELNTQEAKNILNEILSEFCFKTELDKTIAISYLLTPMCRGLYSRPTSRTPLFIILANRERAGKDYLAGVIGIIYEGRAIDDTPFVTTDKDQNNNEELRKKLTSAIKQGRRRIHSSNNKGNLNNAVLEQFLTSEIWKDRELGHNKELELNNEVDVSLSANIGITYTPDLWFRSRPINLFYAEENPNERQYTHPDLWGYIKTNRDKILSAIYTLIKNWVDAGSPPGRTPFTSFPEWARVIGGIMDYHKFGDPCLTIEDEAVGGDRETSTMKELFTFMADYNLVNTSNGYTISELRSIVQEALGRDNIESFLGFDFTQKSTQTKFGFLIKRYVGREFLCNTNNGKRKIKLVVSENNIRAARVKYLFKDISEIYLSTNPEKKSGNVVTLVTDSTPHYIEKKKSMEGGQTLPNVTTLPKPTNQSIDQLYSILLDVSDYPTIDLLERGFNQEDINKWVEFGFINYSKPGFVKINNSLSLNQKVLNMVKFLNNGELVSSELLLEESRLVGLTDLQLESCVVDLLRDGLIFSPKSGFIKIV